MEVNNTYQSGNNKIENGKMKENQQFFEKVNKIDNFQLDELRRKGEVSNY